VLSGHIDTVPADTPVEWRHAPFGAEIDSGNLFGRGAFDMKAGVAMNLTILAAIRSLGLKLGGDLIFETVVDEEYGGVNGTLAARLRGYTADAAVLTEPTYLKICPAQRGGRTLHIFLRGAGGILPGERPSGRVIDQLTYILAKVPEFAEQRRRRVPVHPYYTGSLEPFAVWVTNISTGRWGWSQPITVPERCRIEIYWQAMPDETRQEVEGEFFGWWNQIVAHRPDLFARPPEVTLPMRWLPGCSIPPDSPLVEEFSATASAAGLDAQIEGMDAPSDMYIFPRCFNMPALMWGPKGAAAHQADESVELDSLVEATRVLLHFVCRWCGVKAARA
jgi:acetylornithine deacetylase